VVQDGDTVTINQNISILNLTIGQGVSGCLLAGDTAMRTSTINGTTTINTGASMLTGVVVNLAHIITF